MTTNYPGALDNLPRPTSDTDMDDAGCEGDVVIDNLSDAIEAVQGELGVDPAGSAATVVARLDALDSTVGGKAPTAHTHTLTDVTDAGGAAALEVGTTAGTVAAGDDSRITGAIQGTLVDANTLLGGTVDNTPAALAPATVIGILSGQADANIVASSGATETIPLASEFNDVTMSEACEFTFPTIASGNAHAFALVLRGAFTPTFPASVDWSGGAAPTYTTPALYVFSTVDAGTVWLGSQVGKAFA
jgi:hypothetical protein